MRHEREREKRKIMKIWFVGQQEDDQSNNGESKGPIQLIILFLHSLSFIIPPFLSFFHSFASICKGFVFFTGFPVNLWDPLKTYRMIL